jgi:hypothetical protein
LAQVMAAFIAAKKFMVSAYLILFYQRDISMNALLHMVVCLALRVEKTLLYVIGVVKDDEERISLLNELFGKISKDLLIFKNCNYKTFM